MSILKTIALFSCTLLLYCNAAYVDTLPKCTIEDSKCHTELIQNVIRDTSSTGMPELSIPVYDPLVVENISVTILGLLSFKLKEGIVKGVKDCKVLNFKAGVKDGLATLNLLCDINIKGKYRVEGSSPQLQQIFGSGNTVEGEGDAKLNIEKLHLTMDMKYNVVKRDDGEIYFNCTLDYLNYQYDIQGKGTLSVNNIYLGKQESSELVNGFINDNFKFVVQSFGKPFVDKAMEIVYNYLHDFFRSVPASKIISNDLTPYL